MDLKRILEGNLFYTCMTYKRWCHKKNLKIPTYPPTILIWGVLGETPIYVNKYFKLLLIQVMLNRDWDFPSRSKVKLGRGIVKGTTRILNGTCYVRSFKMDTRFKRLRLVADFVHVSENRFFIVSVWAGNCSYCIYLFAWSFVTQTFSAKIFNSFWLTTMYFLLVEGRRLWYVFHKKPADTECLSVGIVRPSPWRIG